MTMWKLAFYRSVVFYALAAEDAGVFRAAEAASN